MNATVYLPKRPGIYPGIVCPTGHSTKTGVPYQRSCQAIARNGYVVISFDPPGMMGELRALNDHFTNGLIGYLTGFWSAAHFVLDALRCVDYLRSRPDVDHSAGIGMTGVSGGGVTSLFSAILDESVAFVAPVCCLAEHEQLHFKDLYSSCPEQFGYGFIAAGMDYADYVALVAPRPCLIVAGRHDTLFDYRSTIRVYEDARRAYALAGASERCGLFMDEASGHDYSLRMAAEVVCWANRFLKNTQDEPLPLTEKDVEIQPAERLLCHPSNRSNMFTINRGEAVRLRSERAAAPKSVAQLQATIRRLLGLPEEVYPVRVVSRSEPSDCVYVSLHEIGIQPDEFVHVPGVWFTHKAGIRPTLLWIDEQGKWSALRQDAFLVRALQPFEQEGREAVHILSLDVAGFGRLAPEPVAYDLCAWSDIERILTYLSIANAKPIMGLRVRDALCALAWLKSRPQVDSSRIILGGRGVGAIVALHVAALDGHVHGLLCMDMLSHYGALTEQFPFTWPQSIVIPGILKEYDLPELLAALPPKRAVVFNPLDAQRQFVPLDSAQRTYQHAIDRSQHILCGKPPEMLTTVLKEIAAG